MSKLPRVEPVRDSAASIARAYRHQLHDAALAYARLLVKGCCVGSLKRYAGEQHVLRAASEAAPELVGAKAENTFRAYCHALWAEEEALEKRWTHRTTNDAIDEAFADLASHGVVALQNAGGDNTTGWEVVSEEIARLEGRRKKVLGSVFYHAQDTARAIEGAGLMLTFGARDGSDEGAAQVARRVIEALAAEGVSCAWSGAVDQRIQVLAFDWKKRRTTKAPAKQASVGWRSYRHADGRTWSVAGLNNHVFIRVTDGSEVVVRQRASDDLSREIAELVAEQLQEGFVEAPAVGV